MSYFKGYFRWRFIRQEGLEGTELGAKLERLRWLITEIGSINTRKICNDDPFHILNCIIPLGLANLNGKRAFLGVIFHRRVETWQTATKRLMAMQSPALKAKGVNVMVVLALDWTQNRFFVGEVKDDKVEVRAVSWRKAREPLISVLLECAERCYGFLNGSFDLTLLDKDDLNWLENTVLDAYLGLGVSSRC
jgi:hypothetical protein